MRGFVVELADGLDPEVEWVKAKDEANATDADA